MISAFDMVVMKVITGISLETFVPSGSESALKITPLLRSIEKNTESRLDRILASALRLKFFTATVETVTAISSVSFDFSLQEVADPSSIRAAGINRDDFLKSDFFTIVDIG